MPSTQSVTGTPASAPAKNRKRVGNRAKRVQHKTESKHAVEEIVAYIVIRDGLLAEAEKNPNSELLRRLSIANDFVEHCLIPVRPPYDAQSFPQIDAARERQRCESVKKRIAQFGRRPAPSS